MFLVFLPTLPSSFSHFMCALQQNREHSRLIYLLNNSTVRERSLFITWEGSEDFCLIRYCQVITALVSLYFRILANYIVWNVIQDEVSFLSKPYRKARTQYRERVLGSKGQKKRWKTCVTFTNELLGDILGSAYVEHHFSNSSKKMVRKDSYLILLQAQKLTRHLKTKNNNNTNKKKLDQP